ncbi:MAG: 3-phosphoserine/phosphohydroxythreonine transaminase [Candidatus Thermoplasmatota archaeon]|nr:3-phosphoserine/phosphohydroxythreonine transaminase [Candidatus Thermoplasmatota archaeon]MBU1942006.1 3-phosphoserine/phosphohydroxythreonine transaminase [Candidatus Thermoplasmatota archaeon]
MTHQIYNFYAGPATLPLPVLQRVQKELLNFEGTGMSVLEISHRSKEYDAVHKKASQLLRELMGIPDNYKILWLQGGASTQFFMVPLNLQQTGKPMEYVHTGIWSKKAIKEAKLYGSVNIVASSEDQKFTYIPKNVEFTKNTSFAHITGNETIGGIEWQQWPTVPKEVPLVCDMSSNLMDKVIDVKKFGVIYAGAQKNLGPAGVTVVIVRDDLLTRVPENTPTMLKWKTHADKDSLFNTCPCFSIYFCERVLEHLKTLGGITVMEKQNRKKAKLIYDVIDNSHGFYRGVAQKDSRSLMNITFNLSTPELEASCVEEAKKNGLIGLKGHRDVGGMRASIYNAMPLKGVEKLVEFLKEFKEQHE